MIFAIEVNIKFQKRFLSVRRFPAWQCLFLSLIKSLSDIQRVVVTTPNVEISTWCGFQSANCPTRIPISFTIIYFILTYLALISRIAEIKSKCLKGFPSSSSRRKFFFLKHLHSTHRIPVDGGSKGQVIKNYNTLPVEWWWLVLSLKTH